MIALGDITKRALSSVGITEERVQAVAGEKDCGCKKRQDAMNEWGFRWQHYLLALYSYALYRAEIARHWLKHSRLAFAAAHFRNGIRVLFTGHP